MKTGAYNIVIELPAAQRRRVILASRQLQKRGGMFMLGERSFIPHLSVYLVDLPIKNEKKIIERLKKMTEKIAPVRCDALRYQAWRDGYVEVVYKKSKAMLDLQARIVAGVNPLREGVLIPGDREEWPRLSAAERTSIKRFGYRRVGRSFRPHVTLSRFVAGSQPSSQRISKQKFSFRAGSVGFYRRGPHGTCKKCIASFLLTG